MANVLFHTRPCIACGSETEMLLNADKFAAWQSGMFVQDVWPEMTPDERELLLTGIHANCWDEMFRDAE